MTVCGGWSLVKHDIHGTRGITLWCRSWSCPDCLPHRVKGLKKQAAAGHPTTFITLTVNPAHGETREERARELSDALKILVKRARRKFRKVKFEYMAVFEETKKGEPHLHILARAPFIPQRWLSETMNELIEAPIVDVRRIHSARHAANYVAKYVGKGPKAFGSLKRYWASQGYAPKPKGVDRIKDEFGPHWYAVRRPLWMIREDLTMTGNIVVMVSDNELWAPLGGTPPPNAPRIAWRDRLNARRSHG